MKRVKALISITIGILLLMLGSFALALGYAASKEGFHFNQGPVLEQSEKRHGNQYHHIGEPQFQSLSHNEFPDLDQIISFIIRKEKLVNGEWVVDETFKKIRKTQEKLTIGDSTILIKAGSKIWLPVEKQYKAISETSRFKILYKSAPNPIAVWATYDHGFLTDGTYDRLIVYNPEEKHQIRTKVESRGQEKTYILLLFGGIFVLFALFLIYSNYRILKKD